MKAKLGNYQRNSERLSRATTLYLFRNRTGSFLKGMSTIFNLYGHNFDYKTSKSPLEADMNALRNDWEVVGLDIENAVAELKKRINEDKSRQLTLNL